ncbi:transporter [Cyclobacterium jeungdonense]|uniref:Uncharacterized protein n=1 Tax=Cyclobacterium jeungdonense TaxID=708087 RepID=A0ABT8C6Q2_9BACT|nr:transporter [Cyclobacterium jeungdonense]MDN3688190.1 hypothetical protein [Cyclobacterium jeungdonense]
MKNKLSLLISCTLILFFLPEIRTNAQGCVAIRQFSGIGNSLNQGELLQQGEWNLLTNYRYFRSFRHFKGSHEEPDRVTNNTEVINWSHSVDLNISYAFTNRLYGLVSLPFVYNERSSLYEHGRTERHTSYSQGIADMRIGAGYWLLSGDNAKNGNMAIGASLKLPTGNYNAKSSFFNVNGPGSQERRPVDQSIQPGDGGFGLIVDTQGLRFLGKEFVLFYDGFYLINPRTTNGTRTFRETLSPVLSNEAIMAVPDQFALRAGIFKSLFVHGMGISLGGRIEGVPVRDLFGGDEGFRRPGYVISIEPGFSYMINNLTINLNVPVALHRNRTRSVTDIAASTPDNYRHGDAAFADYLLNVGLAWRFVKKETSPFNQF